MQGIGLCPYCVLDGSNTLIHIEWEASRVTAAISSQNSWSKQICATWVIIFVVFMTAQFVHLWDAKTRDFLRVTEIYLSQETVWSTSPLGGSFTT